MDAFVWFGFLTAIFGTSVISGMVGMIGGMVLLAILGLWFPPAVVIPLHGCIQLMSNGVRVALLGRWAAWDQVGWFALGATAGAALGLVWVPTIPSALLSVLMGTGCLLAVWTPQSQVRGSPGPRVLVPLGALATFLSLVMGAVGPLLDAFFARDGSPQRLLGTKAAFQATNHVLKVLVYGLSGFALGPWAWMLLAALPATLLGNQLGQVLARSIPPKRFLLALRWLVTGLAILVVFSGLQNR